MTALRNFLIALALLWAVPADAANRFAVCVTTCTWDGSSTAMWSTTTGGATGASVPGSSDVAIFDAATCVGGVTCTTTVNTNVSVSGITMSACTASTTGCILDFSVNNNTVTQATFTNNGSGTRTLKMGSNTWTVSANGTWNISGATNFTLTAGTSTLVFAGSTSTTTQGLAFLGTFTYNVVTFQAMSAQGNIGISANGSTTIATLNVESPNYISWNNAATVAVTTLNLNSAGTSNLSNWIFVQSSAITSTVTFSLTGAASCTYCAFRDVTITTSTLTANPGINFGHANSGITYTPPTSGSGGKIIGG